MNRSILVGGVVICAILTGCGGAPSAGGAATGPRTGKLKVTATIGMIADVAQQVGGAHVEVIPLMGPGVDPHLYKASQGDLEKLSGADVVLYNGLHLEGRMADTLVNLAKRVRTEQVTETIPVDLLREPAEFQGHYDPHVWFDVSLWRHAAERCRDIFVEMDPAHQSDFIANAEKYLAEMDALHAYAKTEMATIPEAQRVLITAHDAFGYFGRAYGIEVMGIQGVSTAGEYGLQDIERLVDVIVSRKVKAVFVESSVPTKSVEALIAGAKSKGHDVVIGGQLFSDAMGNPGTPEGTYLGMVRHNVDTIVKALK
jgi:manganese/zinc/iron transport system substrate-binding protein